MHISCHVVLHEACRTVYAVNNDLIPIIITIIIYSIFPI